MRNKLVVKGHVLACLTVLLWGTTFISTKVLLGTMTPLEILCIRFMIGYLALWIVCPKFTRVIDRKHELYFVGAGLCGVTLYFLMENIALTYTQASNVGIIVAVSPFFTVLAGILFLKQKFPEKLFLVGFVLAMAGIALISFEGSQTLQLNPKGDILALGAAIVWALYSTITKKITTFGYDTIPMTRRIFFYGLIFMIPVLLVHGIDLLDPVKYTFVNIANILFLGVGASAMCFVTWNHAVQILGTVKTSVYIYMVPVVTTVASMLVLKEQVTLTGCIGITMILCGLMLSLKREERKEHEICEMCNGN